MRVLFLLGFLSCFVLAAFPQAGQSLTLTGKIDSDTGTVYLYPVGNGQLYPPSLRNLQSAVVDSHFVFKASICEPQCFRILIKNGSETKYISDYIILDTGYQTVVCHMDSAHEKLVLANRQSKEASALDVSLMPYDSCISNWEQQFDSLKAAGNGKIDDRRLNELNALRADCLKRRDSLLLSFITLHPRSWPAFWKPSILFSFRYEQIYPEMLESFDGSMQASYSGKALAKSLAVARAMATGSMFPAISLVDIDGIKKVFGRRKLAARYTLVDLWFSSCTPCRAQFGALKELYRKTARSQFSMVGISTDDDNHVSQWKKAIQNDGLPWKQFRDAGRVIVDVYNINQFPTNFLLDSTGTIIKKDLSPGELAAFLSTETAGLASPDSKCALPDRLK